jgi:CHAT domain-containing protein/Tfp pilus assembly protein PilF
MSLITVVRRSKTCARAAKTLTDSKLSIRMVVYVLAVYFGLHLAEPLLSLARSDTNELTAARTQIIELYRAGKLTEAAALAERIVEVASREFGSSHREVAYAIANLAKLKVEQAEFSNVEELYQRALSILETEQGPRHPEVADVLNNLAVFYSIQNRYVEAIQLLNRAVSIVESSRGSEDRDLVFPLNTLGLVYESQGDYEKAALLYRRTVSISERTFTPGDPGPGPGVILQNLAGVVRQLGGYSEAELIYQRALGFVEQALGPDHPDVATVLNNLVGLYLVQSRYRDAEPLLKRALMIREKTLGVKHIDVADSLINLEQLYLAQGIEDDVEAILKRALDIYEAKFTGSEHQRVALALNDLGLFYGKIGRYGEAEEFFNRALIIFERVLGPGDPQLAKALNNLANVYLAQAREKDAEATLARSVTIYESVNPSSPELAAALSNLAGLYVQQGRFLEADHLYKRALGILETELSSEHAHVARILGNLGALNFARGDWQTAVEFFGRGTGITIRRSQRPQSAIGQQVSGESTTEASRLNHNFLLMTKAAFRLSIQNLQRKDELSRALFQTVQWTRNSQASVSLIEMATREAKGYPRRSNLIRERQDLVHEWMVHNGTLNSMLAKPAGSRNMASEQEKRERLAQIDNRISEIDQVLAHEFPDYAALVNPQSIEIENVQELLKADEALILFVDTPSWHPAPEETFLWVITKTAAHWHQAPIGMSILAERVQALRCGLDREEWAGIGRPARCARLLRMTRRPKIDDPLPFDLGIAYELYRDLLGQFAEIIKGKHLLLVPSGPLTSLPFHVLVTEKPTEPRPKTFDGYKGVAWLGQAQPLTVLPAVASLHALRKLARESPAVKAYIGYGDPLLSGDGSCRGTLVAPNCESPHAISGGDVARLSMRRGLETRSASIDDVFRSGASREHVLAEVRSMCRIPDTAFELKCVARNLGVPESELRLGEAATEADIKRLSATGELANYRIVHFATHGLLAGDMEAMALRQGEPALVMSPPSAPEINDEDGLLTASEVAQLTLNADWVVLSACNTAAGDALGAEALSGLARAFFYAGARALLVSHWPVYSDAAVQILGRTFAELGSNKKIGRSEALRRAMIALMNDSTEEDNPHPSVWAPFAIVGEGAS